MLPAQHKLHSSAQFRATMKRGRRAGSDHVVVHLWDSAESVDATGEQGEISVSGGPRFGLIVSKAVGNAVLRHRTSRRLRHVCAGIMAQHPELLRPSHQVVIRALAGSAEVSSAELDREIHRALKRAARVHRSR